MLGHWVDLDPYFLHRERVLRLIRTDRAAEQLARWDPHRALTPSSPAHLATALGLALPALDTAELPRLVYEHGMAVGRWWASSRRSASAGPRRGWRPRTRGSPSRAC